MSTSPYAAAWAHLSLVHDYGADALPVVADHGVPISPNSLLRELGKTPSLVNRGGVATGIARWTEHVASDQELDRWSRDPRLGVFVQCRRLRALDIDVEDSALADAIEAFLVSRLGELPCRFRANSGKRLLAYDCAEPDIYKRAWKGPQGLLERLATGQGFVFSSLHPSGVPYEWRGGLPAEFPALKDEDVIAALEAAAIEFGLEELGRGKARQRGARLEVDDPVVDWLYERGLVEAEGADKVFIACPWESEHSSPPNGSDVAWLIAGSEGHAVGHFSCRHASCSKRTDTDFLHAIGYTASDFEVLPTAGQDEGKRETTAPRLLRDTQGRIEPVINNIMNALQATDWVGFRVGFDDFKAQVMVASPDREDWRPLTDCTRTEIRLLLERKAFKPLKREDLRDAIRLVAERNRFDSAVAWLEQLAWDGKPRVESFLVDHFGAEDTPYVRATSRYWWSAHAARILVPGCQADMVPILVSPEGRYKSTALQALVPDVEFFCEIDLAHKDKELSLQMRGKLLGELAELRGLRGRSAEANKAWVTRRYEAFRVIYTQDEARYARRLVLVGTTNDDDFLDSSTGDRRWLPVRVNGANPDRLASERDLLWAEAREMVRARVARGARGEVDWEGAYELSREERAEFKHEDVWATAVARMLAHSTEHGVSPERLRGGFTTEDAIIHALGLSASKITPLDQRRMAGVLRSLGFEQVRKRTNTGQHRLWLRAVPECASEVPGAVEQREAQIS